MKDTLTRRDFLKTAGIGTLGMAALAALAACGGNGNGSGTANEGNNGGASANSGSAPVGGNSDEVTQQNAFVAEKVVAQTTDPNSLEPFGQLGLMSNLVYHTLGAANQFSGEMKSVLMESWEQSGDNKYSVVLKDGILDTNGNQIKASDVKFSVEKIQENGRLSDVNDIDHIEVTGDLTFDMVFVGTPALGAFDLMCEVINVVSQASYEASADGMVTTPVGCGPYKLDSYVTSSEIVVSINEDYFQKGMEVDTYCEMQNVKVIDFKVITEASQIAMALQTKAIDYSNSVNAQDLPNFRAGGPYAKGIGVYEVPGANTSVLCFNVSDSSPLHDYNLRMAIMHAIDTDLIVSTVNGGNSVRGYVLGGPLFPDYNPAWEDLAPEFDLDKAKEYLAKSEYPDGCELRLLYMNNNASIADAGVAIQGSLQQLGIKLVLDGETPPTYLSMEGDPSTWDFTVCGFGGTGYVTNVWRKYFDWNSSHANLNGTPCTKNFVVDQKLQDLMDGCSKPDTHTQESVNACWEYISSLGCIFGLYLPTTNYVYNSDLIESFGFDFQGGVKLGGCTYKG